MNSLIQRLRQSVSEQPIALHSQSDESSSEDERSVQADDGNCDAPVLKDDTTPPVAIEQIPYLPLTARVSPAAPRVSVAPMIMQPFVRQGKSPVLLPSTGTMLRGVMPYPAIPYRPSRLVTAGHGARVEPASVRPAKGPPAITATAMPRADSPHEAQMAMTTAKTAAVPTTNILVIGDTQSGKSSFVNAFRAAVVRPRRARLPLAPVGRCGSYGTTTVEPYPDDIDSPSWLCIDTPGLHHVNGDGASDNEATAQDVVLQKLIAGLPWRTKLVGRNALTSDALRAQQAVSLNRAHQCILVVPATALIRCHASDQCALSDMSLWQILSSWWERWVSSEPTYEVAPLVDVTLRSLRGRAGFVGELMNDRPPFIVVTKMDCVGGSGARAARRAILTLLGCCVPSNQVFFVACPTPVLRGVRREDLRQSEDGEENRTGVVVDPASRAELVRLYEQLTLSVRWARRLDTDSAPAAAPQLVAMGVENDNDSLALYTVD